jgi:hypothetical protein
LAGICGGARSPIKSIFDYNKKYFKDWDDDKKWKFLFNHKTYPMVHIAIDACFDDMETR